VCWAAHFGWLHLEGTKLGFLHRTPVLLVFTLLALGELIVDKLPNTPPRTAFLGMSARIIWVGLADMRSLSAVAVGS